MSTKTFEVRGDTDLAFMVRMLADRYQLRQLVEEVDSQLEYMLSKENVLSFFGRLIGSNSNLEAKCLKMLELDGQRILEQQEARLDQIIEEKRFGDDNGWEHIDDHDDVHGCWYNPTISYTIIRLYWHKHA